MEKILDRLRDYAPTNALEREQARDRAAVLVPIVDDGEPSLVLTRRASKLGSHAGEVAWPGGKADDDDESLLYTALRESEEEIALPPDKVEVVTELRPFVSKFGLLVTPFVGLVQGPVELVANEDELDAIFQVPLSWLANDPRTQTDVITRHGEKHVVPVYHYDGFRIWGLTAMILWEFMQNALGTEFDQDSCDKLVRHADDDWKT